MKFNIEESIKPRLDKVMVGNAYNVRGGRGAKHGHLYVVVSKIDKRCSSTSDSAIPQAFSTLLTSISICGMILMQCQKKMLWGFEVPLSKGARCTAFNLVLGGSFMAKHEWESARTAGTPLDQSSNLFIAWLPVRRGEPSLTTKGAWS